MSVVAMSLPMRALRPVLLSALLFGMAAPAMAADPPFNDILRGSQLPPARPYQPGTPVYYRWDGLYFGGQIGRTESGADMSGGVASLVSYILRNDVVGNHVTTWATLGKDSQMVNTYGVFVGYNMQWEQAIIGLELNYNRIKVTHTSSDTVTGSFNDDFGAPSSHHFFYNASVTGSATATLTDYGTIRARAAWEYGRLLPYMFGGLAVGRGTVFHTATVSYTRIDIPDPAIPPITPIAPFVFGPQTRTETISNRVFFGYTFGAGIDIAILPNVFVRGEWEYIQFKTLQDVNIHLNTLRVGAGIRF